MFNTRLKKELEHLREENARAQQIKESIYQEMLVMEIDLQGRILSVNENFLNELQYRRDTIFGRMLEELIPQAFHLGPN